MLQFFYRYINGNESDNVPGCPACTQSSMEAWTQSDEAADNLGDFFDVSKPLIGFEEVRTHSAMLRCKNFEQQYRSVLFLQQDRLLTS